MTIRTLPRLAIWLSWLLALELLVQLGLGPVWAQDQISVSGTYRDEQMTVQLVEGSSPNDRQAITGTIRLGEQKFPLKATAENGRIKGTFESEGTPFDFTGTIVGRSLTLTTGGTTYHLTKQAVNPLARPARPNPLALAHTNQVAAPPNTNAPLRSTPAVISNPKAALQLLRYSILDDPIMIGGEAFSLLIPLGWQVEGGVGWRIHATAPIYTALRVSNPARTESVQAFPTIPFIWAEGGIPLFPTGSNYLGNEVREPLPDAGAYIKQILLPRFRRELLQARVISVEDLPSLAEAIQNEAVEPGVDKKFHATRLRVEYPESGRIMQEDFYCVLLSAYVPAIKTTFWGADRNYSFRAEKGRLESESRIFQTMVCSFRPNLNWFNRYVQLLQILAQVPVESLRQPADLATLVARTTEEVTEPRKQLFERQQAAQAQVNRHFAQYVHGMQRYVNPFDQKPVDLPENFREIWASLYGQYAFSDDPTFDPNAGGATVSWKRVQKAP